MTIFLALSMALFAFATILGWGLYGIRCRYLLGSRSFRPRPDPRRHHGG
ncbi:MAG: hypothetical protein ACLSHU_03875 [Oscillospiraceae bacterium]